MVVEPGVIASTVPMYLRNELREDSHVLSQDALLVEINDSCRPSFGSSRQEHGTSRFSLNARRRCPHALLRKRIISNGKYDHESVAHSSKIGSVAVLCFFMLFTSATEGFVPKVLPSDFPTKGSKSRSCRMSGSLDGKVAVVTGASRGIGKGIAVTLGQHGCTVYVTGRSAGGTTTDKSRGRSISHKEVGGTLEETAEAISQAGGKGIAVACDHADDTQVKRVFDKVEAEQGRLDLLVNNAFRLGLGAQLNTKFWEQGANAWDPLIEVGLRSHYMASCYAAPLMIKSAKDRKDGSPGLIVCISSFGGLAYTFNVAYGVGKAGVDRLASDMGIELEDEKVAVVSLYPGIVATERMERLMAGDTFEADTGIPPDAPTETPFFTGRAVAALAVDPEILRKTGKTLVVAELAKEYGFTDVTGENPPSIRSLRFMLPTYVFSKVLPQGSRVPSSVIPDWLIPFNALRNGRPPT